MSDRAAKRTRSRWILGALLSVLSVTAALVIVINHGEVGRPAASVDRTPDLPAQELLSASMQRQPVPGWMASSSDLGFPAGTVPKVIGSIGGRGYVLGITGTGWWFGGIDLRTGIRIFPPVELARADTPGSFDCFVNGPTMVLCLQQPDDPGLATQAWVVDGDRGSKLFVGPTELRIPPTTGHPEVRQVDNYAIATVSGEGVHGIGPHAELTWFVPGGGNVQPPTWSRDVAPQNIAVQAGAMKSTTDVVFSLEDGAVVKPAMPQGGRFGRAIVYPGGFGYEYSAAGGYFSDHVAFFDPHGRETSRLEGNAILLDGSADIPMVQNDSSDDILALDGRKLLDLPKSSAVPYVRLIGHRVFLSDSPDGRHWRQYDLQSNTSGATCDVDSLGSSYIASDGEVAILTGPDVLARGIDLATCRELWSLPGETQSEGKDLWRVGNTLVERVNDQLHSLVAPN